MQETHINVTVDFTNWGEEARDLRIPVHQSVKALIINLTETLKINYQGTKFCIKVRNKAILLSDDDKLTDFQVTNGDILEIL